jgi:hypothetical protein
MNKTRLSIAFVLTLVALPAAAQVIHPVEGRWIRQFSLEGGGATECGPDEDSGIAFRTELVVKNRKAIETTTVYSDLECRSAAIVLREYADFLLSGAVGDITNVPEDVSVYRLTAKPKRSTFTIVDERSPYVKFLNDGVFFPGTETDRKQAPNAPVMLEAAISPTRMFFRGQKMGPQAKVYDFEQPGYLRAP